MMPIGPLMIEHRLIERMIALMASEVQMMKKNKEVNPDFIETTVDFIRTYADQLHHGKEEAILFRELAKKPLSTEHEKIMKKLISEHVLGRINTDKLDQALNRYLASQADAINEIITHMETLADVYPKHIETEDKHFFIPVMSYFSPEEQSAMLRESCEFDQKFIHKTYQDIVAKLDGKKAAVI